MNLEAAGKTLADYTLSLPRVRMATIFGIESLVLASVGTSRNTRCDHQLPLSIKPAHAECRPGYFTASPGLGFGPVMHVLRQMMTGSRQGLAGTEARTAQHQSRMLGLWWMSGKGTAAMDGWPALNISGVGRIQVDLRPRRIIPSFKYRFWSRLVATEARRKVQDSTI